MKSVKFSLNFNTFHSVAVILGLLGKFENNLHLFISLLGGIRVRDGFGCLYGEACRKVGAKKKKKFVCTCYCPEGYSKAKCQYPRLGRKDLRKLENSE